MSRTRRNFLMIVTAAAASAGAILWFGAGGNLPANLSDSLPVSLTSPAKPPVEITIASAVTKQKWMQAAADSFLADAPSTSDGAPIKIRITSVLSGESMLQIADGRLTPTVWSPGEETWIDQLDGRWRRAHAKPIASATCKPTVQTPVGLAMWQPMAEAMGWPDQPISVGQIIDLANDPKGWESLGHPEWGRLRLGHTHPQYSSAGLLYLASVIYAVTGKTEGITPADIYAPEVEQALTTLEQNTARYGMVTTDLLNAMARQGPSYLHVTSAFEEGTLRLNAEQGDKLPAPLVFVFPKEGTFWSNQPYCILDQSGWVNPAQAEAAGMFLTHLLSPKVQATAPDYHIRPLDADMALPDRFAKASKVTVPDLEIPSPTVSETIIDQFLTTKRKATVMLVLDTSGSMSGEPIVAAARATADFLGRLDPRDRVGIVTFDNQVRELLPISPVAAVAESAQSRVRGLALAPLGNGTDLYGGMCEAARKLAAAQTADKAAGQNRIYGMVLLSDGKDNQGRVSPERMFHDCLGVGSETEGPRVFVLAFGSEVDGPLMDRIAADTRGARFNADAVSVGAAYLKISAEQ